MALQKQPVSLNFSRGLDTKADPYQIPVGAFLNLENSVFTTQGRLTKRNGYKKITTLPNSDQTTLTTLNDNLIATGSNLYSFSETTDQWLNKGTIQPIHLSVQSLVKNSTSQSGADAATAASGLVCLAYMDSDEGCYQVSDSATGEQIIPRTSLPPESFAPRVFLLGQYFIITFFRTITAATHLQYIAVPISLPTSPSAPGNITSTVKSADSGYDGFVANNNLYLGWEDSGGTVNILYLTATLGNSPPVIIASHDASLMSITADISGSTPTVWLSFWDSSSNNGYAVAFNQLLAEILAPQKIIDNTVITELTGVATAGLLTAIYENANTYGAGPNSAVKTDFVSKVTLTQTGTMTAPSVILRSVGLASKPFFYSNGDIYFLVTYGEDNQPTYFLVNLIGNIYMRLAYSNGGGYESNQVLPSVSLLNDLYIVPYLTKDFLATVNKGTSLPSGTPTNGIYTQTGINLAKFNINTTGQYSSEIANTLHLTGGQLWEYDSVKPVEHGFQVWPENMAATSASTGGSLTDQIYYYVFTYEWTDNEGNLHRSAPSIPLQVDDTSGGADTNLTTLYVPTLRLTYKVDSNPVRIVGYRWSAAQQVYYQFTSITSPILNDTTVDYVTFTDGASDADILGQTLLYTTGGVIENIAAPASVASALFSNRLFLIDAEDPNLLWFSKQVIEAVPVEMSDLLTIYVAPTSGAQGSTGPMTALAAMDDKLIIFKKDAIYYINGSGPDNTGSNSTFSDPIFITSAVGCANPNSIVLMPNGLMFQSDKGIWLLGRDLSTSYIGAPVERYNNELVMSSRAIPGANQVRFVLGNNVTLMYDYYFNQWGTFSNVYAISSTLSKGLDTYLNSLGQVYRETPGLYLDGSQPVLMSLTTGWINIAGLQGYERFYFGFLLGTYYTPFRLNVQLGYDYSTAASQNIQVVPDNFSEPWGGEALWGSGQTWGGPSNVFEARFFPQKQKCESFQVSINEIYDPSLGQAAGQGLTLSGMNLVVGLKKGYRTQRASKSFG